MKPGKFTALMFGAVMMAAVGSTTLYAGMGENSAGQSKCGAKQDGKCGDGKAMKPGKCGASDEGKKKTPPGKCGEGKNTLPEPPAKMKCGAGKCGQ